MHERQVASFALIEQARLIGVVDANREFGVRSFQQHQRNYSERRLPSSDGSTVFVKNAQAIQLGKVVTAVGIFSIFEARLQDGLNCSDGFAKLRKILLSASEQDLALRFEQFAAAVNVLKHGRGRSYNA